MKVTLEIKGFIEAQVRASAALKYGELAQAIKSKYGVRLSPSTISRTVRALKLKRPRGRKRIAPIEKRPARSIFLECAGSFFLKGAELETGLLPAMSRLLKTRSESARATKALNLAQQINAVLLYAPIFELKTAQDIAGYNRRGLLYLTGQKDIPSQESIAQYLRFLVDQKLLLPMIKEVAKLCTVALSVRIDFSKQTFYLDGQCRTVWPNTKIPRFFSATLNKTKGYVKSVFQSPSPQRPLILQTSPGYTFLPTEMFNLIQCFEQAAAEPISRIVIADKSGETLDSWQNVRPRRKCFFIALLSPWQYARLQGTRIVRGFRQYFIGPEKEAMAVADAEINLFNSQLSKNVGLRAALVRRKEERLVLITNISRHEERYIRKIAEQYFWRWPAGKKVETYYDLLDEAQGEALVRSHGHAELSPLSAMSYRQRPEDAFRLFLEHLHRYAVSRFFPSEYETESLKSMREKFYRQEGFLKIKQDCHEIFLRPFSEEKLQKDARTACRRFNQSRVTSPSQKHLCIYLM